MTIPFVSIMPCYIFVSLSCPRQSSMLHIVDEGWQSFVFWNCLYREKFLLTFCLSMMMFLPLCFIWSQKKSLTQTGENLLCFTFKLWLLSASDSASINLCCLREIVSTSLTFRFQQLEYQVFPFKSLFWSCTCSRNKKLVHWKPSPTPHLPSLLPLNLSWMQWPTGKGLLRF